MATSQVKELFEDYDGFVEKFKPKKTTDDCYTPEPVYSALVKWIDKNLMSLEGKNIVRPFWPGADYTALEYKPNDVVIDNPPFSIVSKICRWYSERNIKSFLFAPGLTLFSSSLNDETYLVTGVTLTYHNGAKVNTSFRTNFLGGRPKIRVSGDLHDILKKADGVERRSTPKKRIIYPDTIITAATLGRIAVRGVVVSFDPENVHFTRKLDCGISLFGNGFLLSDEAAKDRIAAENKAVCRSYSLESDTVSIPPPPLCPEYQIVLSHRELDIIKNLGK